MPDSHATPWQKIAGRLHTEQVQAVARDEMMIIEHSVKLARQLCTSPPVHTFVTPRPLPWNEEDGVVSMLDVSLRPEPGRPGP